eukprot:1312191-Pyramimonas_sp.AAC.1
MYRCECDFSGYVGPPWKETEFLVPRSTDARTRPGLHTSLVGSESDVLQTMWRAQHRAPQSPARKTAQKIC